jgi:hypothetical protein
MSTLIRRFAAAQKEHVKAIAGTSWSVQEEWTTARRSRNQTDNGQRTMKNRKQTKSTFVGENLCVKTRNRDRVVQRPGGTEKGGLSVFLRFGGEVVLWWSLQEAKESSAGYDRDERIARCGMLRVAVPKRFSRKEKSRLPRSGCSM